MFFFLPALLPTALAQSAPQPSLVGEEEPASLCAPLPVLERCGRPGDGDCDGLADEDELSSDPAHPDTDGDGLSDGMERLEGTAPDRPDSDMDGLSDCHELRISLTSPTEPDTDCDGRLDGEESESDPTRWERHPIQTDPLYLETCKSKDRVGGPDNAIYLNGAALQGAYTWQHRVDLSEYPNVNRREGQNPDLLLGVALSGGGYRAANFGHGALNALSAMGLLEEVDYYSTVSGGSYPVALRFAAELGEAEMDEVEAMERLRAPISKPGFILRKTLRTLLSRGRVPTRRPAYTQTDHVARALDCNFMPHPRPERQVNYHCGRYNAVQEPLTLGDLFERGQEHATRPMWVMNAATLPDGQVFPFTPDVLENLNVMGVLVPYGLKIRRELESVDEVPLLTALMATSNVPGSFPPVHLEVPRHVGEEDAFVQLVDGGFSDRFGLATLLDLLLRHTQRYEEEPKDITRMAIVVDTRPAFEAWDAPYREGRVHEPRKFTRQIAWSYESLRFSQNYLFYDMVFGYPGVREGGEMRDAVWWSAQPSLSTPPEELLGTRSSDERLLRQAVLSCASLPGEAWSEQQSCSYIQAEANDVAMQVEGAGLAPERTYLWRTLARPWFSTTYCKAEDGQCGGAENWGQSKMAAPVNMVRLAADALVNPAAEWDAEVLYALGDNRQACIEEAGRRFVTTARQPTDMLLEAPSDEQAGTFGHEPGGPEARQQALVEAGWMSVWVRQFSIQRMAQVPEQDLESISSPIAACAFTQALPRKGLQ